jgi:hypothetical protein
MARGTRGRKHAQVVSVVRGGLQALTRLMAALGRRMTVAATAQAQLFAQLFRAICCQAQLVVETIIDPLS